MIAEREVPRARAALDTAIARLVEQDLEPRIEHVHTLACVAGANPRGASGGEVKQLERRQRVLQQQRG